jgi:hypothetical protein
MREILSNSIILRVRRCDVSIPRGIAVLVLVIGIAGCAVEGPIPPGPVPYWYDYYFYPSVGVYFNIHSGYYYYRSGGRWVHTLILPPTIRLDQKDRHSFRSKEPEPFRNDREHRDRFKPIPHYQPNRDRDHREREFNRETHKQYRDDRGRDKDKRGDKGQRKERERR